LRKEREIKRKEVWLLASCLIVAGLVLASCAPAAPTPTPAPTPAPAPTPVPKPIEKVATPAPEIPRYGGTFIIGLAEDILGFDEAYTIPTYVLSMHLTDDKLLENDWTRGQAGTFEADWSVGGHNKMEFKTGCVAERWEIPARGKFIFHIRKGVRWHDKPPVNGRELTAEDVVFHFKRLLKSPMSHVRTTYPEMAAGAKVTAPDKWTVVVDVPREHHGDAWTTWTTYYFVAGPSEMIAKYGDMRDWRNSCGVGPFMLTDYVAGSSATFVKHPNYWMKDPIGPGKGNKLPYVDGVRYFVITDVSTRLAALRTAKIDRLTGVIWEDAESIKRINPEIKYADYLPSSGLIIGFRLDKPGLPFRDKRVRQALHLAIDWQAVVRDFFAGKAEILSWPNPPGLKGYEAAFYTFDELPGHVRELFQYNPEKAKKLLAEAGYPKGFRTKIICQSVSTHVDFLSVVKDYWAKIGVDLTIMPREYAVYMSIRRARTADEMILAAFSGVGGYFKCRNFWGPTEWNASYIDDPAVDKVHDEIAEAFGIDDAKVDRLHKELIPHLLEQCYVIARPNPYSTTFWQPWVKNYRGEIESNYYNAYGWSKYIWLDQDLKEKMTGRR